MSLTKEDLHKRLTAFFRENGGAVSTDFFLDRQKIEKLAGELAELASRKVYVAFSNLDDPGQAGVTLGPFSSARIVRDTLTVHELNGSVDEEFATFDTGSGLWYTSFTGPAKYEAWTDVVISPRSA